MDYYSKYLKYKNKYINLKNHFKNDFKNNLKGGLILIDNIEVEKIINLQIKNIDIDIRNISNQLTTLDDLTKNNFLALINKNLSQPNELGKGQFGTVYDLSPNYVLKIVDKLQSSINKSTDIENEIRTGFFVEKLNEKVDLYGGNLAYFDDVNKYYIIMKKYKNIDNLQDITGKMNIIDVAINLICQLYILTKFMLKNNISHGDEKFDNLMFEEVTSTDTKFTYTIDKEEYHIKNCGFKLKLIDWGESTGSAVHKTPMWDSAWIQNLIGGSLGKKKDAFNKGYPTSDYLILLSKVLKLNNFLQIYNDFDVLYKTYFNPMNLDSDLYDKYMELYNYNTLIGDASNNETLLRQIGEVNIPNLYNIFMNLYDSRENNFLLDNNFNKNHILVPFSEFKHYNYPRVSYTESGDLIKWKICDSINNKNIIKLNYNTFITDLKTHLEKNTNKYIIQQIDKSTKPPKIIKLTPNKICTDNNVYKSNSGDLMSGSINYYIFNNINSGNIIKDLKIIKKKLDTVFDTEIDINFTPIKQNIYFGYDNKYLYVISKNSPDFKIYIFEHSGITLDKNNNIKIDYITLYNYGGICISEFIELKNVFTEIVDIAQRNGISLDLSPLGFFHYHLNYNKYLNMFFGIVHAKIEITTELDSTLVGVDGYMNKRIQKEGSSDIYDLTGNKDVLIKEHNFIFSLDNKNNFKLYQPNCISILHGGIGINDNFFNTNKFAEINYHNQNINGKSYVFIYKTYGQINNIDFTKYNSCQKQINYKSTELDEIIKASLNIDNYKKLREDQNITHDEAKDVLMNPIPIDVDIYIQYRGFADHLTALSFF